MAPSNNNLHDDSDTQRVEKTSKRVFSTTFSGRDVTISDFPLPKDAKQESFPLPATPEERQEQKHPKSYKRLQTKLKSLDITPFLDLMLSVAHERDPSKIIERASTGYKGTHVTMGAFWLRPTQKMADIVTPHPSADSMLKLVAYSGIGDRTPSDWNHTLGTFDLVPVTEPIFASCQKGIPSIGPSPEDWNRPKWAIEEGYYAYSSFPVMYNDEFLGILSTFYDRPMIGPFAQLHSMHQKMHKIFADTVARALVNAVAFEEIQKLRGELELENELLRRVVQERRLDDKLIGDSDSLVRVMEQIDVVSPTDASVLLLGESGTGKELLAEAIHSRSTRSQSAFVRVNCSAIPHELFESEFFGHVKGSFTGAIRDRVGRFQMADGGTLFLDEVGEIPLELQGKLLRVLQEGTFEQVGDDRSRKVNVRIVAATNKDLTKEVAAGRFRQDLYFRLSVFPINVPPLRERRNDIPLLTRHFISLAAKRMNVTPPRLKPHHVEKLQAYDWPGNVRELQNVVERAVIMSHSGGMEFYIQDNSHATPPKEMNVHAYSSTQPTATPPASAPRPQDIITEAEWTAMQRENILQALDATNWRVQGNGGAAEILGIKPTTLRSRMQKLGIKKLSP
ncbi:sigma-54 interaction domain-containing protein [Halodesulfovibrio marinisediminis]|uniref:Transcriptional regulator containing GAF, AAA-type ATPase, and DNA-binding Fis domains n=1 Tax=Halodesulfovibrio marinisediminis DSM 17456 TaxID=1121457 RepID=A0A1N6IW53_9BACT|nr:sigma 54-interacting transcriptional regulator [Halodesulfovibrio marinisediminis]SIO36260.1 Transcriptional regulator containing GAF, AAA-type ATPase, and DNA-binding Fis domains [Halodesulfovibrio marinisediminis DSM 17456]